jgi:hypothetical protein
MSRTSMQRAQLLLSTNVYPSLTPPVTPAGAKYPVEFSVSAILSTFPHSSCAGGGAGGWLQELKKIRYILEHTRAIWDHKRTEKGVKWRRQTTA